jgi:hypothetical protein
MAWLESHQSLANHRKLLRLADLTGVSEVTLIGHLHLLWWWALDNVGPEGSLEGISDRALAVAARWPGDAGQWTQALVMSGFLDEDSLGVRWLHDWHDYAGKLLERRAEDRARKRAGTRRPVSSPSGSATTEVPAHLPRNSDGSPAEISPTSTGDSSEPRTNRVRTVPNSTVPNRTVPNPTEPQDPPLGFASANPVPPLADAGGDPSVTTPSDERPASLEPPKPRHPPRRRLAPDVRALVAEWRAELTRLGVPLAPDWHLIAGSVVQTWVDHGRSVDEARDWWTWASDHPYWAVHRHEPQKWRDSFGQWRLSQGAPLPRDRPNGRPRQDWLAGGAAVEALLHADRGPPPATTPPTDEEGRTDDPT